MLMGQRFASVAIGAFALTVTAGIATPARAADGIVDELKVGVLAHDVNIGGHHKEGGADINGEVLFTPPEFFRYIFNPRPHIGGSVNTDGNTDQAYFGLTWRLLHFTQLFTDRDGFYLNGSLGGSVNDGKKVSNTPDRKDLGSHVLFRESLEIGYEFVPRQSVSIFADHISDAGLTNHNDGLTNIGVRYGYGF
jgi:lipid A 3-O-deacylase